MEFKNIQDIENATTVGREQMFRLGSAVLFIVGTMLFASTIRPGGDISIELVIAAMIGGYMAMNIGANDVANNVGPAVGSRALTLVGAIVIAGIFEALGALVAGGDVVGTIKNGIINPELIQNADVFIWLMMAALLAGAIWLNVATAIGAPVSTTHAIVGGVLGAGMAAGGMEIANWSKVGSIALSWVISPVIGAVVAAAFLYWIKRSITYQKDMLAAGTKMVPLMIAVMVWAFSSYLLIKGLNKIWKIGVPAALVAGFVIAVAAYFVIKPLIAKFAKGRANKKSTINAMFTIPLIFAAALLSFAHGANDVANAVGPLAAIYDALQSGELAATAAIPLWIMGIGALGIVVGLTLFGPKLIRTVGQEITDLDQMRAFSVAMAAAITVIFASQFGLPVSSTHIAIGGIFGVGFLREYLKSFYAQILENIHRHYSGKQQAEVEEFINQFDKASLAEKQMMIEQLKKQKSGVNLNKHESKALNKAYKNELVKRSALWRIVAAWLITVPVSGLMAAILFFTIRGMMLP